MRVMLLAVMLPLALALVSPAARAEDTEPPKITFTPVTTAKKGAPVHITAKITDESKFFPQVFYRYAGGQYEKAIDMKKGKGKDVFEAAIPYKTEKLEYYLECYDELGNGPARAGDPDAPFKITLGDGGGASKPSVLAPPPVPANRSSGTTAPSSATSSGSASASRAAPSGGGGGGGRIWTWVVGGTGLGLLAGGLVAGLAVKTADDAYKKALAGSTGPTGQTTVSNTDALQAQLDANKSLGTKATILAISGGVLLGAAVGLFFLESPGGSQQAAPPPPAKPGKRDLGGDAIYGQLPERSPERDQDRGLSVGAVPLEGGAAAVLAGRF